jgi:hypothetical protein
MKLLFFICVLVLFVHSNVIARPAEYIDENPEHGIYICVKDALLSDSFSFF